MNTPEFPFLTALLSDRDALKRIGDNQTLLIADAIAKGFSGAISEMALNNGVAMLALMLYAEQLAERLAMKLNYDLGPRVIH